MGTNMKTNISVTADSIRPSCVDWAACEAEYEAEREREELLRELAESEDEDWAMDAYCGD